VRGGVSNMPPFRSVYCWSSPRAWGCFYEDCEAFMQDVVFPTCVGVFPIFTRGSGRCARLPHVRGGVSGSATTLMTLPRVFPTCVGVFPFCIL